MDENPTHFWLTDARYIEGKRAVALEFSRLDLRRMARHPFFPYFFVRRQVLDSVCLKDALSAAVVRFKVEDCGNVFKVSASTFSGLNELADLLFKETGFRPLVLGPERQFLLEKNWGYFDCFASSENEFICTGLPCYVPMAKLGLFSEPLPDTVRLAAEENSGLAEKILESIALSNILKLPVNALPNSAFGLAESLLEGILWRAGTGMAQSLFSAEKSLGKKPPAGGSLFSAEKSLGKESIFSIKGTSEVDFSMLWPLLLARPFYNLGPDSIDCGCCMPKTLSEKNVLPSSLVFVEMLKDGFFFESCSSHFSDCFHKAMPGKESRLRRMQEFCLKEKPIGPFFRSGQTALLLADALALESRGEARILGPKSLHWFCLEKEGSVSRAVSSMNSAISSLENCNDKSCSDALRQHGVLAQLKLSTDPDFLFRQALLRANSMLLCLVPEHLCRKESAFFSQKLCFAVEAIQAAVLESFRAFAGKRESRVVAAGRNRAIVSTEKPYSLIRQFSEKQRIPAILKAKSV
ncbi:MAG: hypothetical protein WC634_04740 [archaeon]